MPALTDRSSPKSQTKTSGHLSHLRGHLSTAGSLLSSQSHCSRTCPPLSCVPCPWLGLAGHIKIFGLLALHVHCAYSQHCKSLDFCDKFATKVIYHRDVLCASSAKGGWQLITTLIVAIDGGAVFSQFDLRFSQFYRKLSNFDLSRTLIALLTRTPPKTPLFRPISAAAGFNWKWLFIAWFGGYCNRPICHGAMLSYWTQWLCHALALWQNLRLSTT